MFYTAHDYSPVVLLSIQGYAFQYRIAGAQSWPTDINIIQVYAPTADKEYNLVE